MPISSKYLSSWKIQVSIDSFLSPAKVGGLSGFRWPGFRAGSAFAATFGAGFATTSGAAFLASWAANSCSICPCICWTAISVGVRSAIVLGGSGVSIRFGVWTNSGVRECSGELVSLYWSCSRYGNARIFVTFPRYQLKREARSGCSGK